MYNFIKSTLSKYFIALTWLFMPFCINAQCHNLCDSIPFSFCKPDSVYIPDLTVTLSDYGGRPDGITLNTDAFEAAISDLSSHGGGHLMVTDGIWLTGPIKMRSNIDMHLSDNALILFSPDKDLYPILPADKGTLNPLRAAPISASGQTNFSITGSGIIDGNGEAWRPVKRFKVSDAEWKAMSYLNMKEQSEGNTTVWYPTLGNKDGEITTKRPRLLRFIECSNFVISGVTVQNSPSFHVNMILCRNFVMDGITVRCPWNAQNGDGIDLSSCRNALLVNCTVDAGDDAICMKSGIGDAGREKGPCSEIVICNCTVFHGHGGFVIGSDTSGGMNNIYVSNCRFIDTDTGLRFKSGRGRGGLITNVFIKDIVMCDIAGEAVLFDCYYQDKTDSTQYEVSESLYSDTPHFDGISIRNITCTDAERPIVIKGLPEMMVRNVEILNSSFCARKGCDIEYAENISLKEVTLKVLSGAPIVETHSENITYKQ